MGKKKHGSPHPKATDIPRHKPGLATSVGAGHTSSLRLSEDAEYVLRAAYTLGKPTRLLNLVTGEVTEPKSRQRYAIVSYVWSQWDDPAQVVDTCRVILQGTGITAIWIDQLCVMQDSMEDKQAEIPRMAEYYEGAAVCIALLKEAEISDTCFGRGKRDIPHDMEMWQATLQSVDQSVWKSRVWTYQEAALSKNLLLVGKDGVISQQEYSLLLMLMVRRPEAIAGRVAVSRNKNGRILSVGDGEAQARVGNHPFSSAARAMEKYGEGKASLVEFWKDMGARKCAVEEDLVYGVLGMLQPGEAVSVEYGIGFEEAATRVFKTTSVLASIMAMPPSQKPGACWLPKPQQGDDGQWNLGDTASTTRPLSEHVRVDGSGLLNVRAAECRIRREEDGRWKMKLETSVTIFGAEIASAGIENKATWNQALLINGHLHGAGDTLVITGEVQEKDVFHRTGFITFRETLPDRLKPTERTLTNWRVGLRA
ncbi:het domain protein [Colletotrichum kahawae]|uniref:Het domain protein n=1 Tax=Colletotrichum kahawae TaxID=34407 RepID=A0AAD9XVU9_COLKA|nr:het domain protein [Colletotrichum kahawae]